jgi:hypothetical protein
MMTRDLELIAPPPVLVDPVGQARSEVEKLFAMEAAHADRGAQARKVVSPGMHRSTHPCQYKYVSWAFIILSASSFLNLAFNLFRPHQGFSSGNPSHADFP